MYLNERNRADPLLSKLSYLISHINELNLKLQWKDKLLYNFDIIIE